MMEVVKQILVMDVYLQMVLSPVILILMNQVLKGGPHVPNNQLYQTLGVPVAIWGRGGPKPVWVGTWPAGRRGAASTGRCAGPATPNLIT